MTPIVELLARGALGLVVGVSLATGCAAAGADGTAEADESAMGEVKQGLTSVDMVDCSICATARACCNAVSAASYCNNFDAQRCETLDPGRQRTTRLDCLVLLRTTIYAWQSARRTPPSECRIPGE